VNSIFETFESPAFPLIYASFYAVDVFFWISGLLCGYLCLQELERTDGALAVGYKLIHRAYRLLPPLAFTLFISWAIFTNAADGPLWYTGEHFVKDCPSYWWTLFLFLNNWIPNGRGNTCFEHGWYIATDFQFYLLMIPLILLYYKARDKRVCWWIIAGLGVVTSVSSAIATGVGGYQLAGGEYETDRKDFLFEKPYAHIAVFAFGVAVSWVLRAYSSYRRTRTADDSISLKIAIVVGYNLLTNLIYFVSGFVGLLIVVWVQRPVWSDARNDFQAWSIGETVMFVLVERILVGLAISSIMLPLLLG
jgi:peptidoglycan/LPS O-acetylase OafA/YrhL